MLIREKCKFSLNNLEICDKFLTCVRFIVKLTSRNGLEISQN